MATLSQSSSNNSIGSPANGVQGKRRRCVKTATASLEVPELQEEDDAEELRNRRLQHIVETAKTNQSPVSSPIAASERRQRLLGKNGMTNVQISEHYTNCLKLSAENKINQKNAFNLHLIDFMSDMLQHDDAETNFQVAGTTLDASAKIYAYRVDSVHRETFKIAGGLGRPDKDGNRDGDDGDGEVDEDGHAIAQPVPKVVKKRRKKITKGHTIETNEKALNMVVNDSQFAGDALFDKVRSNFDEGGSSGLFLNTLSTAADTNQLLLHCLLDQNPSSRRSGAGNNPLIDTSDVDELLAKIELNDIKSVCSELGDFGFLGWQPTADVDKSEKNDPGKKKSLQEEAPTGMYAVELPPTPPPPQPDFGLEEESVDEDMDGGWERASAGSAPPVREENRVTLDTVASALSSRPLEYSYFDPNMVNALAGANHWKVKAKLNSLKRECEDNDEALGEPVAKGKKKTVRRRNVGRKRKEDKRIDFAEEIDTNAEIPMGSGMTLMTNVQLLKWKDEDTLMPSDASSKADRLRRLFSKPDLWILGEHSTQDIGPGETSDVANGNDAGPSPDQAPNEPGGSRDNDDDAGDMDIDFGAFAGEDVDDDDANQMDDGDLIELQTDGDTDATNGQAGDAGEFTDGLLQQPYKVNKIAVPYARQAKKIDVRRLKRTIWTILTKEEEPTTSQDARDSVGGSSPSKKIAKPKMFSSLCAELPELVPANMAENLSVPVIFVCLLHMCNEKNLFLSGPDDMADFEILPGGVNQDQVERETAEDDVEEEQASESDDSVEGPNRDPEKASEREIPSVGAEQEKETTNESQDFF